MSTDEKVLKILEDLQAGQKSLEAGQKALQDAVQKQGEPNLPDNLHPHMQGGIRVVPGG